jgi:hypothetical protein
MTAKEIKEFEEEIKKDEEEYLDEISEFEVEDIGMVLDYFSGPFFQDSLGNSVERLCTNVKKRILMVLDKVELRLRVLVGAHRQTTVTKMELEEQQRTLNALRLTIELVRSE